MHRSSGAAVPPIFAIAFLVAGLAGGQPSPLAAQTGESGGGAAPQAEADAEPLDRGRALYFEGNYTAALELWQPLAESGNARALYNVAQLYRRGLGVKADPAKARALLQEAAKKGFAEAQYLTAMLLFDGEEGDGRAGPADEAARQTAVAWWLAAARQGHALSQYRLGLLYWNGEAVARDLERGYGWMLLAADQGVEMAVEAEATMARYLSAEQRAEGRRLAEALTDPGSAAELGAMALGEAGAGPQIAAGNGARAAAGAPAGSGGGSAVSRDDRVRAALAADRPDPAVQLAEGEAPDAAPGARAGAAAPKVDARGKAEPLPDFAESWRLQLAALKDKAVVEKLWDELEAEAPDLVGALDHRITAVDLGGRGVFYRLQIGPFDDWEAAVRRCQALKAAGHDCFPVAPGA